MKRTCKDSRTGLTAPAVLWLAMSGCDLDSIIPMAGTPPQRPTAKQLPPAYLRSQINDPMLREVAQKFKTWVLARRSGADQPPFFSRVEVLIPTQTVLPYGVGAFQQELRLPAILTTGPGWADLKPEEKEAQVVQVFRELSERLAALKRDQPLRPTLTIQIPQGIVLGWINALDEGRKHLHGEDD